MALPRRQPGAVEPPRSADPRSTMKLAPAMPCTPAPLYLAEGPEARAAAAAASFGAAWTPPPLDYRSAAPPPEPVPPAEARTAPIVAPSAPTIDLEAVSRNVMGRIEKRLRIERERRGRS